MVRREKERTKVEPKAKPRQKAKTKVTIRKVAKAAKASHQVFRAKEKVERLQISLAMCAVKLDTLQRTAGMVECAMWHQVWLQVQHLQTGPILQACHNRDRRNRMRNRHQLRHNSSLQLSLALSTALHVFQRIHSFTKEEITIISFLISDRIAPKEAMCVQFNFSLEMWSKALRLHDAQGVQIPVSDMRRC